MTKPIDLKAIEAAARAKLTGWRSLLTRQTQDGRELLRQVLDGPVRFIPDGKRIGGDSGAGPITGGRGSNQRWRPLRDSCTLWEMRLSGRMSRYADAE